MALIAKAELLKGTKCSELELYDRTGLYNAADNPGGFGAPNSLLSDITQAILRMKFTNGALVDVNVLDSLIPFPNTDGIKIKITSALAGLTPIPDGLIDLDYILIGNLDANDPPTIGVLSIYSFQFYNVCNVDCCVKNLFGKIDFACKTWCETPEAELAQKADELLTSLNYAIECGNYTNADCILSELQELCTTNKAGCGGCP